MLIDYLQIVSLISPDAGRPTGMLPTGRHCQRMAVNFDRENYAKRWQVETVMYVLKNKLADTVAARTEPTWADELSI